MAQGWDVTVGSWDVEDMILRNTTTEIAENFIYNGNTFGDYTFTVRANPDLNKFFGLIFNYQDEENYYLLGFSAYPMLAFLRKVEDGVTSTIEQQYYSGGGAGVWLNLKLVNEDGMTTVLINDKIVLNEVSTPDFTTGRIGLYAGSNSLWFDDVKVSAKQRDDFVGASVIEYKESGIYVIEICGNTTLRCKIIINKNI